MHELSVARPLMQSILKKSSGKKPSKIIIAVGAASGIDADFLRHSFDDHIFPEMNWEDIELAFEKEEPALRCGACGKIFSELNSPACSFCGSDDIKIAGGDRVYVKKILL